MKIAETQRLTIEKAVLNDAHFFLKLLNSPNWITFIGNRNINSEEDARNYIEHSLISSYTKNGYGLYKVSLKENSKPIGICGFVKRDYLDSADIGFAILPKYENQGYTLEASKAMLKYGKTELNLNPILGITTRKNIRSQGLLKKIGLKEIGKISPDKDVTQFLLFSTEF
ncbi:GNAT family N-acetyltransferase [Spongiimicrobium sp. 3-5]|uniref:GNAT family N-acetyltransferase n=1 Tax=Spongiimicrobium sp. 3-5 TaxID=3332596 RepID=UPI003981903E